MYSLIDTWSCIGNGLNTRFTGSGDSERLCREHPLTSRLYSRLSNLDRAGGKFLQYRTGTVQPLVLARTSVGVESNLTQFKLCLNHISSLAKLDSFVFCPHPLVFDSWLTPALT